MICNRELVDRTFRSKKSMRLKSNGGIMVVNKKAEISGYHAHVWYDKNAIVNILALHNIAKQYRVTYDSDDKMFVVHRESVGNPNMEFRMHKSGIHYYNPRNNVSYIDYTQIPGVYTAEIPGVDTVELPGVDGDAEHAPESVEVQDLDNTAREAEPVAPAPIAQPAEPQGAVVAATEDGSDRNVEAANTVRNDVKATRRSARIWTQTATQLESQWLNPDAHMFVIEDGTERPQHKSASTRLQTK
jgi:hypothetical protein